MTMTLARIATVLSLAACMALPAACTRQDQPANAADAKAGADAGIAARTVGKVRDGMATHNLALSSDNGAPKAEITPQGDLLVGGDRVAIDDAQRALLLRYRGQLIDVASAGAEIGVQGANFGMKAAGKALAGALTGNGDRVDEEIEAQAREFEKRALVICDRLAPLLGTQQQLAGSLPAFRPYATMDQSDIDDCRKER
jgi:hypothetical protein